MRIASSLVARVSRPNNPNQGEYGEGNVGRTRAAALVSLGFFAPPTASEGYQYPAREFAPCQALHIKPKWYRLQTKGWHAGRI